MPRASTTSDPFNAIAEPRRRHILEFIAGEERSVGDIADALELNQPSVTAFPIRETVKDWRPGAYYVVMWNAAQPPARDDDDEDVPNAASTGMWVVDTDIALTSFSGRDGLNVFARSLDSAQPLAGLEIVLLTRGNDPVAKAVTGEDGRVTFADTLLKGRGAAEAIAVMALAAGRQEFSRLELTKAPFDLSDRGVEGQVPRAPEVGRDRTDRVRPSRAWGSAG